MNLFYLNSLNDQINKLVIDEAPTLLEQISPSFDNDITLLKSNYAELKENEMPGTISTKDLRLERNKLRRSILILTDRIEDNKKAAVTSERLPSTRDNQIKKSKKIALFRNCYCSYDHHLIFTGTK